MFHRSEKVLKVKFEKRRKKKDLICVWLQSAQQVVWSLPVYTNPTSGLRNRPSMKNHPITYRFWPPQWQPGCRPWCTACIASIPVFRSGLTHNDKSKLSVYKYAVLRFPDIYQCCWSEMFIPDPGSKKSSKREGWKKICCHTFLCSHKFHIIENYFIFEMLKQKIWANFQRIIDLFTQKIVTKLSKLWVWDPRSRKNLFWIPDLDPQHCIYRGSWFFFSLIKQRIHKKPGTKKCSAV